MWRGLLLGLTACVVLVLGIAVGYTARELARAKETISSLCRETRPGDTLVTFVQRARRQGARVELSPGAPDGRGLVRAQAGLFTDQWTCEARHSEGRITGVEAFRQD